MTRNLLAAVLLACSMSAFAQGYPAKPITMIVPFPPGGVADLTARPLAPAMEKVLKQPVVIVNRTGAGGQVGMTAAAKSAPDGYTVLMGLSSISIFPMSDRLNGKTPAYEMADFAPIALVSADPTVLVVAADAPWKDIREFIASAKAYPAKINYSSSGVYGTLHVAMEILSNAAGIKLFHVPYQGAGPAVAALLGGQVHALASGPASAARQMQAGKMRALASWGDKRLAALPDVPTFKELGYDAEFYIWAGVFAPAATPAPVQQALRDAVRQAVASEEFKATMAKLATPIAYMDAPEFRKYWEQDAKRLEGALQKIGKIDQK
jgi:tripartite-type tricarboxylate transporter receptor subunit TctC